MIWADFKKPLYLVKEKDGWQFLLRTVWIHYIKTIELD